MDRDRGWRLKQLCPRPVPHRSGALWAGTDGGGLFRFDGQRFSAYTTAEGLAGNVVYSLRQDREGDLWIGTNQGLSRLHAGRFRNYSVRDELPSNVAQSVLQDRDGNIWVACYGGGLARLQGDRFVEFRESDGLANDKLRTLYEDREGTLWVGSQAGGLEQFLDGSFTTYSTREGLPAKLVWSAYQDRAGNMWFGTDGGGLVRSANGILHTYNTGNGLPHNIVHTVIQTRDGSMWAGTGGGGLGRIRGDRIQVFTQRDGLSHDRIRALYEDRSGVLWIGTYGGGISRYADGKFSVLDSRQGLRGEIVYSILQDSHGDMLFGTRGGGVNRLHHGRFEAITDRQGLCDNVVLAIHEASDGDLWIGTTAGLSWLHHNQAHCFSRKDGFPDNIIYAVLEDHSGRLWMSSNRGVFYASKTDLAGYAERRIPRLPVVAFGEADGMNADECNGGVEPAGWESKDGRLWFPTIAGVVSVDPASVHHSQDPPPVQIETAIINRTAHDVRAGATHVPPGVGELEFHYTAPSLRSPATVTFRYRLQGFDRAWVEAGDRRAAFYTNIPPGQYQFEVQAANNNGAWGSPGAVLAIVLRPHFYQTRWFYGAIALAIALLTLAVYLWRIRQLEADRRRLEAAVAQRSQELAAANRELQDASLTDVLTKVRNRRFFEANISRDVSHSLRSSAAGRKTGNRNADLVFFLVDIDHFKEVNDRYGHKAGDELLISIAKRLTSIVRDADMLIRWGGEEFLLVSTMTQRDYAPTLAARILQTVSQTPHAVGDGVALRKTCSVGWAPFPWFMASPGAIGFEEVLQLADRALYTAKAGGRDQAVGFVSAVASPQDPAVGITEQTIRQIWTPGALPAPAG